MTQYRNANLYFVRHETAMRQSRKVTTGPYVVPVEIDGVTYYAAGGDQYIRQDGTVSAYWYGRKGKLIRW